MCARAEWRGGTAASAHTHTRPCDCAQAITKRNITNRHTISLNSSKIMRNQNSSIKQSIITYICRPEAVSRACACMCVKRNVQKKKQPTCVHASRTLSPDVLARPSAQTTRCSRRSCAQGSTACSTFPVSVSLPQLCVCVRARVCAKPFHFWPSGASACVRMRGVWGAHRTHTRTRSSHKRVRITTVVTGGRVWRCGGERVHEMEIHYERFLFAGMSVAQRTNRRGAARMRASVWCQ